ncbi:DeoR/GlpR family DNA-binding transcription regulator [Tolumonas lignilytica]|uniref:DeoR/GlpR family DNA-binding transcription regulator n=1 Tax=Tolumonas lignilytica TaxID=1283284 RepID=UPI000464AD21|nr:DeoR/GlpR family DNA-binding transcription regulator [Tolumonas lignilytica]
MDKFSPEERHQLILSLLKSHNKVMATDLAMQLSATEATIRRDLRFLANEGLCKRIHGGALSLVPPTGTQEQRLANRNSEKQALAVAALSIIKRDQVIFLDASSTHMLLASLLPNDLGLTVVTNSPAIATRLLERQHIRTIQIGGELNYAVGGAIDITAVDALNKFRFDLCFMGVCGWSSDIGFSAIYYQDGEFKRQVASRSGAIAALCTDDKIEALAPYPFLPSDRLDYLICSPDNSELKEYFAQLDCTVITSNNV